MRWTEGRDIPKSQDKRRIEVVGSSLTAVTTFSLFSSVVTVRGLPLRGRSLDRFPVSSSFFFQSCSVDFGGARFWNSVSNFSMLSLIVIPDMIQAVTCTFSAIEYSIVVGWSVAQRNLCAAQMKLAVFNLLSPDDGHGSSFHHYHLCRSFLTVGLCLILHTGSLCLGCILHPTQNIST